MEDIKTICFIVLLVLIILVVMGAFIYVSVNMVSNIELKIQEKKIEMLQEKGLLDENSLKIILQNL